jgi:hypothetical protein
MLSYRTLFTINPGADDDVVQSVLGKTFETPTSWWSIKR